MTDASCTCGEHSIELFDHYFVQVKLLVILFQLYFNETYVCKHTYIKKGDVKKIVAHRDFQGYLLMEGRI